MKFLFLLFVIFLSTTQISGSPFNAENAEEKPFPPPPNYLVARSARIVDFYSITRSFIESITNDLRNGANRAGNLISRLLEITGQESSNFLANLNNTLTNIEQNLQNAITNVLNSNQGSSIYQCVLVQNDNINALLSNTLKDITGCVTRTLSRFTSVAEEGRNLIESALITADNITQQTLECGVATFNNFIEVGRCLNAVYRNARSMSNEFIVRLTALGLNATTMITSSSANTAACGTTQLANTASAASQIIRNVTQCASQFVTGN